MENKISKKLWFRELTKDDKIQFKDGRIENACGDYIADEKGNVYISQENDTVNGSEGIKLVNLKNYKFDRQHKAFYGRLIWVGSICRLEILDE